MNDAGSVDQPGAPGKVYARLEAMRGQLQRERERCRDLTARVEALEAELAALRGGAAYRITYPLRWVAAAVPPSIYAVLRGTARSAHAPPPPARVLEPGRPAVLMLDDWFPEPDRDSGSIDIVNMADCLIALGFAVLFAARRDHAAPVRRRAPLEMRGVRTLSAADAPDIETFLRQEGLGLVAVVLNRVYCGGDLFEIVRSWAPRASVLFNTVDLHWIRLERQAVIAGDAALADVAIAARARETKLAQESDATFVVSSTEAEMLRREAPDAFVVELPLARHVVPPVNAYAARDGIGFIGGFRHQPNLDALRWFLADVWPIVLRSLPDCRFSIVGPDLPDATLAGVPGRVEALGHVPDIDPWFETLLLSVAPLRYGAGAKGKVASSLAAGVPCVGTSIALEGMRLEEAGVIAAETAAELAAAIVRLHADPALWARYSQAALDIAERRFSHARWRELLRTTLLTLGVLPVESADRT